MDIKPSFTHLNTKSHPPAFDSLKNTIEKRFLGKTKIARLRAYKAIGTVLNIVSSNCSILKSTKP